VCNIRVMYEIPSDLLACLVGSLITHVSVSEGVRYFISRGYRFINKFLEGFILRCRLYKIVGLKGGRPRSLVELLYVAKLVVSRRAE
jgi:hypothetical protein